MQREFFRQFLAIHMLIVHFTVMMLCSSVTTGKNRRPTFQWHNREFSDAYSTFWYCNLTFPDYNGESTALLYLAFDDITTVIFTIVTGSWTLFFQWQPGFLQWTGNFSCSVLYKFFHVHWQWLELLRLMLFPFVVCTFLGVKGKDLCRYEVLIYEMVMVHERASLRSVLG